MMARHLPTLSLTSLSLLLAGACASGPVRNPEALAKVKRVGIVGFELVQQQPKDLEFSIGGSSDDSFDNMPKPKIPVASNHAADVYNEIRSALSKDLKWSVVDKDLIAKSTPYAAIAKEQTSGIRSLPPVGAQFDVFAAKGIMDYWAWYKLDAAKRAEIASSLKVDALLLVRATSTLKESFSLKKLVGGGNFHPQVEYDFALVAPNGTDVIWSNRLQGKPTDEKAGHFAGISKKEALNKLVVKAAELAGEKFKLLHDGK